MDAILQNVRIAISDNVYIKNPESTELGKRIIGTSILLINEIGFEKFNFKKLGARTGSNESSIYRYFENKHRLLVYLTAWYWGWLEYRLVFAVNGMKEPMEKLLTSIDIVSRATVEDMSFPYINEKILNKIVINESLKSFLTKEVDQDNREGYFIIYKRLVGRISEMITEVKPGYAFPCSLASTILESALHQHFLREHFPSLTDCKKNSDPVDFITHMVVNTLQLNP